MDNTNKNKVNLVLYIVLTLIIVAVVCMTVFSIATGSKKNNGGIKLPEVTNGMATRSPETERTRPTETQNPEDTYIEEPDDDVNASDDEPAKDVDAPVKMVFTNPIDEGYILKGFDIDMPVYSLTMNDYRVHSGLDIIADLGSAVRTIAEGEIMNIYCDPMMGNCISVKHANGYVSYYMGLSEEVCDGIEEGAPVYCGQVLSSVGDSTLIEIAEEPHLHLEVKKDGKYVDPTEFVSYKTSSSGITDDNYEG